GKPDAAAAIVDDMMGWLGGGASLEEPDPTLATEPPRGHQYSGLGGAHIFRFGGPEVAIRTTMHRPRRPVVVDGAVWE
ncbi:MAG: hypothetical protein WBM48_19475, partial [Polyangiales bacterium]